MQTISFENWCQAHPRVLWLQADSLCAELATSGQSQLVWPNAQYDGVLFIWDLARFEQKQFAPKRLYLIYQTLQVISEQLGDDFLLLQGDSKQLLQQLFAKGVFLVSKRTPANEDLVDIGLQLMQSPVFNGGVSWLKPTPLVEYSGKLPNGFFKYWKVAESQLFAEMSPTKSQKTRLQRAHKAR